MVRRVKAYLGNMKVITDEEKLHQLSVECEPHAGTVAMAAAAAMPSLGGSRGRRHPSPTLSTTSSASSTSEGRKSIQGETAAAFFVLVRLLFVRNFTSVILYGHRVQRYLNDEEEDLKFGEQSSGHLLGMTFD